MVVVVVAAPSKALVAEAPDTDIQRGAGVVGVWRIVCVVWKKNCIFLYVLMCYVLCFTSPLTTLRYLESRPGCCCPCG